MKVALVYDVKGWCFWNIACQIRMWNPDWECDLVAYPEITNDQFINHDCVIACGYHGIEYVLKGTPQALVTSCCDHIYWKRKRGVDRLMRAAGAGLLVALNGLLKQELQAIGVTVWGVTEDGVDTRAFRPVDRPPNPRPVVGWCGNSANDGKGLSLIREACKGLDVELRTLDVLGGTNIPHAAMPAWYQGLDLYICFSDSEGTPNPVLEAAACGVPVLSTDVGIVSDLVRQGSGGIWTVPRDVNCLRTRLTELVRDLPALRTAGKEARVGIERGEWSWEHKAHLYRIAAENAVRYAQCK
jgi:glycosyltransferase involved in cell wall biosynthesis